MHTDQGWTSSERTEYILTVQKENLIAAPHLPNSTWYSALLPPLSNRRGLGGLTWETPIPMPVLLTAVHSPQQAASPLHS